MPLHFRDRWLDWTLRVVGVLVLAALLYLAYTIWQGERQARQGSLSSRAISNLEEVVRAQPDNPDARVLLGDAYRDMGSYAAALKQYQAALEIQSDHAGALSGLALVAMAKEEWRTAEGYWQNVIEALRDEPMANADLRLEKAYYYYGTTLIQLGEYEDAVSYLKEALRIKRDDSDTHYALAVAYEKLGSTANQKKSLENALAFVPSMPEANYDLGRVLLTEGDVAGAAELLRRSVDNAPGRAEPRTELDKLGPFADRIAKAGELAGAKPAEALIEARVAIALDPTSEEAARLVARLLERLDNVDDAKAAWARVLELVPNDPEALERVEALESR